MRMTLEAVRTELGKHGMHMGNKAIAECIEQGIFPFGTVISTGKTGRRTFIIMKADFEKWLEEKA